MPLVDVSKLPALDTLRPGYFILWAAQHPFHSVFYHCFRHAGARQKKREFITKKSEGFPSLLFLNSVQDVQVANVAVGYFIVYGVGGRLHIGAVTAYYALLAQCIGHGGAHALDNFGFFSHLGSITA